LLSGIKNLSSETFTRKITLEEDATCKLTIGLSEFHGFNMVLESELILKGDISFGECHYHEADMSFSI
jgi:hypothetical protein